MKKYVKCRRLKNVSYQWTVRILSKFTTIRCHITFWTIAVASIGFLPNERPNISHVLYMPIRAHNENCSFHHLRLLFSYSSSSPSSLFSPIFCQLCFLSFIRFFLSFDSFVVRFYWFWGDTTFVVVVVCCSMCSLCFWDRVYIFIECVCVRYFCFWNGTILCVT